MKQLYIIRLLHIIIPLTFVSAHANLTFNGLTDIAIEISPEANSGLEAIYVIDANAEIDVTYKASSISANVEWSCFSNLGGAYSQPVTFSRNGSECTATLGVNDIGYIITDNGRQHCYWIVNYNNHLMTLNSANVNQTNSDCSTTAIDIDGTIPRINYYTITGIPKELSRDIYVTYNTLLWDEQNMTYTQTDVNKSLSSAGTTIHVTAPLCDTTFDISGDRFLRIWNREQSVTTPYYNTTAIDCHTSATTLSKDNDNEIKDNNSEFGGSAPVEITFSAFPTDAVAYKEWQISSTPDFDIIDLRYNQEEITHTFRNAGTTYVRFSAANSNGDCDWISETYNVTIGESKLLCPNAFSPGATEGVNDEWRVSYKSIVSFECHIFNQWGIELFSTTDPSQGWDGKRGGKVVPAGVYYYVIKARGADGKNYSLSGDINIISYKQRNGQHTSPQ